MAAPARTSIPPPVDSALDLRDFRWMRLDIVALLNSDFNSIVDDTAWRSAVTLWCRAWHQVPAGSLPNDDAVLCNLAGLGRDLRTWKRIRAVALHGFKEATDGRLYHAFLCNMAVEADQERKRFEARKAADRARKSGGARMGNPRGSGEENEPLSDRILAPSGGIPAENAVEGQGQGQGQGKQDPAGQALQQTAARPAPGRAEFDRIEQACIAALGDAAPADPVIGPIVLMVQRGTPLPDIVTVLRSEAKRVRKRPIRTWHVWAEIVAERLADAAPAGRNGANGAHLAEKSYDLGGGLSITETNMRAMVARYRATPGFSLPHWGDEDELRAKTPAELAHLWDQAAAPAAANERG